MLRRYQQQGEQRAAVLCAAYALTPAETEIAIHVASGRSASVIAELRGVSVETARYQIKSVLAKVGVRRQVEFAGLINAL